MAWYDIYDYENEAETYIRREKEKKNIEESILWTGRPEYKAAMQKKKQEAMEKQKLIDQRKGISAPYDVPRQKATGVQSIWEMQKQQEEDYMQQDIETKYRIEEEYRFNKKTIYKDLEEPNFKKINKVKTEIKLDDKLKSISLQLGIQTYNEPISVYKYKTINTETKEEIIVPQTEIKVIGENIYNYYYIEDNQWKSIAKDEVSPEKINSDYLKQMYMKNMNDKVKRMAQMQPSFKEGQGKEPFDIDTIVNPIQSFLTGVGQRGATPLNAIADFMLSAGGKRYAHDPAYFETEQYRKNEQGKTEVSYDKGQTWYLKGSPEAKKLSKEFYEKKKAMEVHKAPKGFSEETDAIAAGASKEEIAEAREIDKIKTTMAIMGKEYGVEEMNTPEKVANVAGEIAGVVLELVGLGKFGAIVSAPAKLKLVKSAIDAAIVGGGHGILNKLQERDANFIDYLKEVSKQSLFFFVGGQAAEKTKAVWSKFLGKPTSKMSAILQDITAGTAFGAAGTAVSYPLMTEEEKRPENLAISAGIGGVFDIVMATATKGKVKYPKRLKITDTKPVSKELEVKYDLGKSLKGLSRKELKNLEKTTVSNMLIDIGKNIKKKVGSGDPKKIIEYYQKKYNLPEKIKLDTTLSGEGNFARVEIKDDTLEVRINKSKNPDETLGALRHEIEHVRDVGKGYEKDTIYIKKPKTLHQLLTQKGHHSEYDRFEIEYLDNIMKTELKLAETKIKGLKTRENKIKMQLGKKGLAGRTRTRLTRELKTIQKQIDQPRKRLGLEIQDAEKLRTQQLGKKLNVATPATNLPTEYKPKGTVGQRLKDKWTGFYQGIVDRHAGIAKISGESKKRVAEFRKRYGTLNHIYTENLVSKEGLNIGNKALKDVIVAPKGYQEDFESYLLHKHHLKRMAQKKPVLVDKDKNALPSDEARRIVDMYEKQFPEYKKFSEEYNQFMDDFMREYVVDGDLLTMKAYKNMKHLYPDYVPTYRELDPKYLEQPSNRLKVQPIKHAKGGAERIVPLHQAIPLQMQKIMSAFKRNKVHQQLLDDVLANQQNMKQYAEIYDIKKIKDPEVRGKVEKITMESEEGFDTPLDRLDNTLIETQKQKFVVVLEKGEPIVLKINDNQLFKALKEIAIPEHGALDKVSGVINKHITSKFKGMTTVYNPKFAIRNTFRDLPQGYIFGAVNNPLRYIKEIGKSTAEIIFKSGQFQQYKALGGGSTNITAIEKSLTVKKTKKLLEFLNYAGHLSENLPRYIEFKALKAKGLKMGKSEKEALADAMFGSGDVTVDFTRGGKYTKLLEPIIPYTNAGIQGYDKWMRGLITEGVLKGNFAPMLKSLGAVTVPTIALTILNNRENKAGYDDLPDYLKDHNYVIPLGIFKEGSEDYLKFPKNRETGFLFSTLLQRMYRMFVEQDDTAFDNFADAFGRSFYNPLEIRKGGIGSSIINISLKGNKDYWGRDIEPLSSQFSNDEKKYRFTERTAKVSKALGPVLQKLPGEGLSPAQFDYLIKSYAGFMADFYLSFNNDNKPLTEKAERIFPGVIHRTEYGGKEKSAKYDRIATAKQKISTFEHESGLKDLKKDLKEKGITSRKEINYRIEGHLTTSELEKYNRLKAEKKKAEEEIEEDEP